MKREGEPWWGIVPISPKHRPNNATSTVNNAIFSFNNSNAGNNHWTIETIEPLDHWTTGLVSAMVRPLSDFGEFL